MLVTEYSKIGGGERNLLAIARELSKENEVTVWCAGGDFFRALKDQGVDAVSMPSLARKRWLFWVPIVFDAKRFLQMAGGYEIIHTYSINVLPLFLKFKERVVHTVHGHWEKPFGLRAKMMERMLQFALPVSKDVEERCSITPRKRIRVPLGVKVDELLTLEHEKGEVLNILCMARFQKIKGQDLLLEALSKIEIDRSLNISFVGGVNSDKKEDHLFYESCKEMATTINRPKLKINFIPFSTNPIEHYRVADLVVIPSRYESFSMVCVEALAAGVPVLAPKIGGPLEIVTDECGLLFDSEDVNSLKEKLVEMIENLDRFKPKALRERAKIFSIDAQAQRLKKVYQIVVVNR